MTVCYNPQHTMTVEVVETSDRNALTPLQDEWGALVEQSSEATIYQTWEWNDVWWRSFGRGKKLLLVLVRDGQELVGLGPFYVARHLRTPFRRLAFLGTGPSDYLGVLAASGREEAVYAEVGHVLRDRQDFDLADLQQIPRASSFASWLEGASSGRSNGVLPHPLNGHRVLLRPIERCPVLVLPATWEEYLACLGKNTRANIGRRTRQAARELPEARWGLCDGDDLPEAMEALFRLHQRRWRARMMPGVLGSRTVQEFHRSVAERFMRRGWLRLHTFRSAGRIVAALHCFAYRRRYYYYIGGFDPEHSRLSLGMVLMASAIQQAITEGCAEFDFLRGHEAYKERWKPSPRVNLHCLIARPSGWRAEAMLAINRIERYIERKAKAFSDRGKGTGR